MGNGAKAASGLHQRNEGSQLERLAALTVGIAVEIVDHRFGQPAAGVSVRLLRESSAGWREVGCAVTDETGHATGLEPAPQRGRYRLVVSLDDYFAGLGMEPFQSLVDVAFRVFRTGEPVRYLFMITPSSCLGCRLTSTGT